MVKINPTAVCAMTNKKLVTGVVLAAGALALMVTNLIGGSLLLAADQTPVLAISALALSIAAFVVSWTQRSFAVAVLLAASGVIFMVPALIATGYLSVIMLPGPILGVIIGLGIFGLGVVKGLRTAMAVTAAPSNLSREVS